MIIRRHMYFSGDVQGVGFRYRSKYAARFLSEVNAGRYIHIDDIETREMTVIPEERAFEVRG